MIEPAINPLAKKEDSTLPASFVILNPIYVCQIWGCCPTWIDGCALQTGSSFPSYKVLYFENKWLFVDMLGTVRSGKAAYKQT